MPLLEKDRLVPDPWVAVGDDDPIPDQPAVLSPARLRRDAAALAGRNAPLGLALPPGTQAEEVADLLPRVSLVLLRLGGFKDGRAFTQARALRQHHGFAGEIRATGHVLPDQHLALLRCGVSTVEVPEGADLDQWRASREVVGIGYQAAMTPDRPLSLLRRRLALA